MEKITMSETTKQFIKNHWIFLVLMIVLYIISAITVILTPKGIAIPELDPLSTGGNPYTYTSFSLSVAASILIVFIGLYLIFRYYQKPAPREESFYQLIWGLSFIIYSLTFIGLTLGAWGFDFANMDEPVLFFVWRSPMIIWVAGMWIGTIMLFSENKLIIYTPAIVILLGGLTWFYIGLMMFENIEQTMYGFLFGEFIPMAVILAYLWYIYRKDTELSSAAILMIGFSLLAITYAAWAPWHFAELVYVYFFWFAMFIVSLAFIMAGFFALPKETTSQLAD
jgi:hypothetical protein